MGGRSGRPHAPQRTGAADGTRHDGGRNSRGLRVSRSCIVGSCVTEPLTPAAAPEPGGETGRGATECGDRRAERRPALRPWQTARMSRTVAIVEDEPAIRDNYAEALRRHGYGVQACGSRASAPTTT